ncbi:oligosaccharide biosynthesis protein Alg14 like protein [Artomyces pyxidatus]|uniref:Oligosaccharide biosynthesis protein Alg14 like protein n=1 Tax=Artomyces pyxidatus TaxID=48021 RepID=A0ACB8SPS0_9AGAM|nr:oligosaccharide biosynthesis protein Alg14 like protein [Artomyces pyxidatus]
MLLPATVLLLVLAVATLRIYSILSPRKRPPARSRQAETCSLAVFLGSGGHSSEALSLMASLDFSRYTPRTYIVSDGDPLSVEKATALELLKARTLSETLRGADSVGEYSILIIPRARRVHQNLLTTPLTALRSLLVSIYHITVSPFLPPFGSRTPVFEVLIFNGPGTCFVLCLAAFLNRFLGLPSPRMIYIESFARVKSLSLTGKLLRPIVDSFVVQWPDVLADGRRGAYYGWLV